VHEHLGTALLLHEHEASSNNAGAASQRFAVDAELVGANERLIAGEDKVDVGAPGSKIGVMGKGGTHGCDVETGELLIDGENEMRDTDHKVVCVPRLSGNDQRQPTWWRSGCGQVQLDLGWGNPGGYGCPGGRDDEGRGEPEHLDRGPGRAASGVRAKACRGTVGVDVLEVELLRVTNIDAEHAVSADPAVAITQRPSNLRLLSDTLGPQPKTEEEIVASSLDLEQSRPHGQ